MFHETNYCHISKCHYPFGKSFSKGGYFAVGKNRRVSEALQIDVKRIPSSYFLIIMSFDWDGTVDCVETILLKHGGIVATFYKLLCTWCFGWVLANNIFCFELFSLAQFFVNKLPTSASSASTSSSLHRRRMLETLSKFFTTLPVNWFEEGKLKKREEKSWNLVYQ